MDTYRASGPGGQHRNKTESAVRLRHSPTGLVSQSCEQRSQHLNRGTALRRLREAIAIKVRRPVDVRGFEAPPEVLRILPKSALARQGAPAAAAAQRVGANHPDFLLGISVILDLLVTAEGSVSATAGILGISTGALSKVITAHPDVLKEVNDLRASKGLKSLR